MTQLPQATTPGYPRPVTELHQIEITSRCNLRCIYCPSPKLDKPKSEGGHGRAKVDMTLDTFERALTHVRYHVARGTQSELSLTGIGETLLHPDWRDMIRLAREAVPAGGPVNSQAWWQGTPILFSTNGLLLDDDAAGFLAEHQVGVYISLHRPEKAGRAIPAAKRHGIYLAPNASAATDSFDWAGQVDWPVSANVGMACEYLRKGWAVVLSDGRVTTCCLDASGAGVVGHVDDEPGSLSVQPYSLCGPCHMSVPVPVA